MPVRPTRVRRLRARKAMGNALLASVVLVGGLTYVAIQKTVTLVVDKGRPEAVRTMSASVGELLDAQGILVGYGDLVTPPTPTSLADGMTVIVERGWLDGTTGPGPDDVGVWVMEGVTAPHLMLASRSSEDWFSAGDPAGWSQRVSADVVVKGRTTTSSPTPIPFASSSRPWGSHPTATTASFRHPGPPLRDGCTSATTRSRSEPATSVSRSRTPPPRASPTH